MKKLRLIVCGAAGRMGTMVLEAAARDPRFEVAGAVVRPPRGSRLREPSAAEFAGEFRGADLAIDFSAPDASVRHAAAAALSRTPIVIGVTGFTSAQRAALARSARRTAAFISPNMSPAMNLLFHLASLARLGLPGYDARIVEAHHTAKKDAPSGTALRLAEAAGGAPVASLRAGTIIGDHTLVLAGPGERLELTHRADDRGVFARGALDAGAWLIGRRPGVYDFRDLLGLR